MTLFVSVVPSVVPLVEELIRGALRKVRSITISGGAGGEIWERLNF
jgi:hypothetical protein